MKNINNILAYFLLVMLGACFNEEGEVKKYIHEIKQQRSSEIPSLPPMRERKQMQYNIFDLKSPFDKKKLEPPQKIASKQDLRLNAARTQEVTQDERIIEPLEKYGLDELKMMGILQRGQRTWALIQDPQQVMHRVEVGNYMGKNSGVVTEITDAKVLIKEYISDGNNGWFSRLISVNLEGSAT